MSGTCSCQRVIKKKKDIDILYEKFLAKGGLGTIFRVDTDGKLYMADADILDIKDDEERNNKLQELNFWEDGGSMWHFAIEHPTVEERANREGLDIYKITKDKLNEKN